jgi:hypothetical protein
MVRSLSREDKMREIEFRPVTLLSQAVTVAVAGTAHQLEHAARSFGVEVSWTAAGDGAVASMIISLDGSLTGTTFEALTTATTLSGTQITAKYAYFAVVDKPCTYVKANISTFTKTGTGATTVTVKVQPMK